MSRLSIFRKREMTLKLPYHAGDHLEAQAGPGLIDIEPLRKAGAVVVDFDVKVAVDFPGGSDVSPGQPGRMGPAQEGRSSPVPDVGASR